MDAINDIASRHGLWVVEDAAEAFSARYKGKLAGGLSSIATFSFYGNKIITSGEGGALTTDDEGLERLIRQLRGQGMDPERRYYFPIVGYNYRLTNVACALLCAQLERADEMVDARRALIDRYRQGLAGILGLAFQPVAEWADPAPWLFSSLLTKLNSESHGMPSPRFWRPKARDPTRFRANSHVAAFQDHRRGSDNLVVTEHLGATGLSLSTSSAMETADADRVIAAVVAATS